MPHLMQIKSGDIFFLIIILAINCLSFFFLMPYSQKSANSHMPGGDFFGVAYYALSIIALILGINISIRQNNTKLFFLFITLTCTFVYWGYKIQFLDCQACANGG